MENTELLNQWNNGLRIRHMAHGFAYTYYNSLNRIIGLTSTLLTAVVTTTIFSSFTTSNNKTLIIVAGLISILATLSSAAQVFLKFGELAERHNTALASFGSLRRELESILIEKNTVLVETVKLQELNSKWSELEQGAPAIPQKLYDKATKIVGKYK